MVTQWFIWQTMPNIDQYTGKKVHTDTHTQCWAICLIIYICMITTNNIN